MAEEENSQDKTEEPSQRKLDKAAEDGQVLSSKEMFVFTTLIMGLMVLTTLPFFVKEFLATTSRKQTATDDYKSKQTHLSALRLQGRS